MNRFSIGLKTFVGILLLYALIIVISSCGKKATQPKNQSDDFSANVLPILQARCNTSGCHNSADKAGGLVFSSFESMRQTVGKKTSPDKPLVIPYNPDRSHLVLTIRRLKQSYMPPSSTLLQGEIDKIVAWINQGAKGPGSKKFPTFEQGKLYVANSSDGRVDIVDLSMNYKVDSIITAGGYLPSTVQTHHIVVSPDKKFIYVTNSWAFGDVVKIDATADTIINRVRAGYQPADIVISSDGQFVYTTDYNNLGTSTSVVRKFNTSTMSLADTFPVAKAPHGVAISKDGSLVLAPSQNSDDCWFIYPAFDSTCRVRLSGGVHKNYQGFIDNYYAPFGIILSKNDSLAYISCPGTPSVPNHQIRVLDVKKPCAAFPKDTEQVVDSIVLDPVQGKNPYMMALSPTSDTLYVACWGSKTVAIIDLLSKTAIYVVVGPFAHAPALAKGGSFLYVTCEGDHNFPYKVFVINTGTQTVVDSITVGRYPNGIGVLEP